MAEFDPKKLRYLLVGTNVFTRNLFRDVLMRQQITRVVDTADPMEAFERIRMGEVDLVMSEVDLVPLNGIELVRLVRQGYRDTLNPAVPIILFSDLTDKKIIAEAREAGVTEYLIKPASPDKILETIRMAATGEKPGREAAAAGGPAMFTDMLFEDIRVVIGQPTQAVAGRMRSLLERAGFQAVATARNFDEVENVILDIGPDLLIIDTDLGPPATASLMKRIRDQEFGPDPFVVAMALMEGADKDVFGRIIASGYDDVMINKSRTLDTLIERIVKLARTRRSFVVTSDYMGPDRRAGERGAGLITPPFEVPNGLGLKATAMFDQATYDNLTERTLKAINARKIVHHVDELRRVARAIDTRTNLYEQLDRLVSLAGDLGHRLEEVQMSEAAETTWNLASLAEMIKMQPESEHGADLAMLPQLAELVVRMVARKGQR